MNRSDLIDALHIAGAYLSQHEHKNHSEIKEVIDLNEEFYDAFERIICGEFKYNAWFTEYNVRQSIGALAASMNRDKLIQWMAPYPELPVKKGRSKTIGVVMAGNIPMVGFHDMLAVLMSGHNFLGKPSSKDERLIRKVAELLVAIQPGLEENILFSDDYLKEVDAIIATGSNNASRYFEFYFKNIPHIIRKNRNGVAVLTGNESDEELIQLGEDIFSYFGLGCRNVTKLFVPEDFQLEKLMKALESFSFLTDHHKYMNNVNYYRTVYLMNATSFLDNLIVLLKEDSQIASPVGVVYFEKYSQLDHVMQRLETDSHLIQCIVSKMDEIEASVAPGRSQYPKLWDYADKVDTMKFLAEL
ncbi:acyl-CoA reductase [Bacteroidota bacterium]